MSIFINGYISVVLRNVPPVAVVVVDPQPTIEIKIDGELVYESHVLDDIIEQVHHKPQIKTKSGFDFFTQTTARAKQQRRG